MMATFRISLCVFFFQWLFSSAAYIPSFCRRCEISTQDPYCLYCCSVFECCNSETAEEECRSIQCGCTTTATTTPETDVKTAAPTSTLTPATTKQRMCHLRQSGSRVLGGDSVSVCDTPWMVHFVMKSAESVFPFCSGVLIGENHILTSSNCAEMISSSSVNTLARFADSQTYLETERPISPENINVKEKEPSDILSMSTLQEANVTLLSSDTCKLVLSVLANYNTEVDSPAGGGICTNPVNASSSACPLDEGGMLLCQDQADETGRNWILAGLAFGTPCDTRAPSTFVNVTKSLDFINTSLQ